MIIETVAIDKEVLDAMFERMTYLHKMICHLFEKMRNKDCGDWLTLEETCNILNVSERKVRNLQSGGRIGFVRYGKKCKYKAEDVHALVMKGGIDDE